MKKILLLCLLMVGMLLSAQINLGEGSTNFGNAPINTNYGYSYTQQIFTKQEINANAAGNITGLKFYLDPSGIIDNSLNWVVFIGHTAKTNFASSQDWVPVGQMTQVFSGTVANANGVVEINFTTPFPYNNMQNLVIAVDENTPDYDYSNLFSVYTNTTQNRTLAYRSDDNNPNPSNPPSGSFLGYRSVVSLMGLTPSPLPICPSVTYPADNSILIPASPDITWEASQGATSYKVSIGTTPGGTDVVNQQPVSTTSFTPSAPLSLNTTYYVKVTAVGVSGESSGCADIKFKTTPPPPSNDDCVNAVNLTINPDMNCGNVTAGTTVAATNSNLASSACAGNPDDDVWYKFTATETRHMIRLSNIVSAGTVTSTDMFFQVFSGSCGTLNSILCSDPNASVATGLTVGETYYVRVYSYGGAGRAQNFDICVGVMPPPPSNDECINAVNLTVNPDLSCGSVTAGTTLSATDSNLAEDPCYGDADDDVWYKFTATATNHIISLSDITSVGLEDSTDTYFQVFSGSCGNLTSILCSDAVSGVVGSLTVGETYYIRVYSYGGASESQSFKICVGTLPPPAANDECANAVALTVNPDLNCAVVTAGHTLGATDSGQNIDPCDGEPDDDVWFKFTATATGHKITLSNIVSFGTEYSTDTYFQVFSGSCGNLTNVLCVDPDSGVLTGLTVGETYYVRVFSYDGAGYAQGFNICVGTLPPPPVNDDCSGALVASVFPYTYTQIDAVSATNNSGFITTCSDGMNDGVWFTFTGDGSMHDISVSMPAGSEFDPQIGVYSGSCGNFTCINTMDSNGSGSTESMSVQTVAGTVYYVNVGAYSSTTDDPEDAFTITINRESLGTVEVSKTKEEIRVYPNPFSEVLNISKADQVKSVSILDISGRLVKTVDNPSSVLHLGDLKQGMYLVVLHMKDGSRQTLKTIKK